MNHIICILQFSPFSHEFLIETSRHLGLPREERYCKYCYINFDIRNTEDEFHVFFKML